MKKKLQLTFVLFCLICLTVNAQNPVKYDLAKLLGSNKIESTPSAHVAPENAKPGAISAVNSVWFKELRFTEGTIDIDLRGKDEFLKSFLGILFHGADSVNYDILFFRPFNFKHADTTRRYWSVQYMSMPDYTWKRLRAETPRKYESTVSPVPNPNDWFHATIVLKGRDLKVYVNHASTPSLQVTLLNDRTDGRFGLFSDGLKSDFANLTITPPK